MTITRKQTRANSVKGIAASTPANPSLGRDRRATKTSTLTVLQGTPDRHPMTVVNVNAKENFKRRDAKRISTWNVRTLSEKGKIDNVVREMKRLNVNIMGISEMRWPQKGKISKDEYSVIYSGGQKHERGVGIILDEDASRALKGYWQISDRVLLVKLAGSPFDISLIQLYAPTSDSTDEDIEAFYNDLETAKAQCKSQNVLVIMGDLNAKVGNVRVEKIVGPHGLGKRNPRGQKWIDWCSRNRQVITNTWFKNHPRRLYTWKSNDQKTRNQIDYITINERFRNSVTMCKAYPGADCGSDHNPVIMGFKLKLKKLKKPKRIPKFDFTALEFDNIKEKYLETFRETAEKVTKPLEEMNVEEAFQTFKNTILTAAKQAIPIKAPHDKNHWMTPEILSKMDERRKCKNRNQVQYKELDREIKTLCNKEKENWLDRKCDQLERQLYRGGPRDFYQNINDITFRKSFSTSGCVKSRDGTILMEKTDIMNRWVEYIEELFEDTRGEKPTATNPDSGSEITREEIKTEMKRMKSNKATGPDNISIEMVKALDNIGTDIMHCILNKIYDSGHIPQDLKQSIFITLPKVKGTADCDKHRTISLMSHIIKLLLRILVNRVRLKLRPQISQVQYGFMKDRGTRNAIFVLGSLGEHFINFDKELHLCFIDYQKAFDKVRHDTLMEMLKDIEIDGKDFQVISNLYWEQEAAVRINNELSNFVSIQRGVRQGCVMSPDFFNLYAELILREISDEEGISINNRNINNLRYADDTVLIADSAEKLQNLINKVVCASERKGLHLNTKKTEYMVISREGEPQGHQLTANGEIIKEVNKFNYLGSLITCNGKSESEIRKRIELARDAFHKLRPVVTNKKLSLRVRKRVVQCYVTPVLMYGCECWTLSKKLTKKLEAFEMWCLRRMLRIPWTDKVRNVDVLQRSGTIRELIKTIKKRQISFIGHVTRKNELERLVLFTPRNIVRGRPRGNFLGQLKTICKIHNVNELENALSDRDLVKSLIVKVC